MPSVSYDTSIGFKTSMCAQTPPYATPGALPVASGGAAGSADAPDTAWRRLRAAVSSTLGRLFIATVALKLVVGLVGDASPGWLRVLDSAGTVVLAVALAYLFLRMFALLQRRLLWRVRRKLVLSYILIGFVPILLIVSFFLLAGWLLMSTFSSSLVQLSFEDVVADAAGLASATVVDLRGLADPSEIGAVLERRIRGVDTRYPEASLAVVPRAAGGTGATAGSWRHTAGPPVFPVWVEDTGSWLVMTETEGRTAVAARGAALVDVAGRVYAVVADLPVAGSVVERMQLANGIELLDAGDATPVGGSETGAAAPTTEDRRVVLSPEGGNAAVGGGSLSWVWFFELLDWPTGERGRGAVNFRVDPGAFYSQLVRGGDFGLASALLFFLMLIGAMFLTIEAVALVMGFALAKSITGAVHELFTGTERVRRGDFSHRIQVDTRDQLGELAGSFNAMTGSIADLLTQAEEKRRLEEELRIARDIQMSLLPAGPASLPGLAVTAVCRPAREVGGDYYEFVPLGEHRLGVLVADVSGKGTSAAFYMAELKGLILSLSPIYQSPKRLLMEVNRILSATLDNRTFITMIYVVVDLQARTLTYVRAGHTPLIYVPADGQAPGRSQVLIPDGLVAGLHLDGIEEKFAELLEERTLQIGTGDLFALFTDGITEAMNEESDLFGEERLSRALEDHAHLPSQELRDQILGDVEAFVGGADQHDDMTIVLLRIAELPPAVPPPAELPSAPT